MSDSLYPSHANTLFGCVTPSLEVHGDGPGVNFETSPTVRPVTEVENLLCDEIEHQKSEVVRLAGELAAWKENSDEWQKLAEPLQEFAEELAAEPCEYGDDCPPFGTRHGTCLRCKAVAALARGGA